MFRFNTANSVYEYSWGGKAAERPCLGKAGVSTDTAPMPAMRVTPLGLHLPERDIRKGRIVAGETTGRGKKTGAPGRTGADGSRTTTLCSSVGCWVSAGRRLQGSFQGEPQ